MKLGCRAHDYGKQSPAKLAECLRLHGYNAAQVALPKAIDGVESYQEVSVQQAAQIGEVFAQNGVEITVLGCYMDLSVPDTEARLAGVENVKHCLALQKASGAKMVGSETSYAHLTQEEKQQRRALMTDSVLRIVEHAAKLDAVFAVEPVFWHPLDSIEAVQQLLDAVADPVHLRMIFDPANVLKKRYLPQQAQLWQQWLDTFGTRIDAMHIKDYRLAANDVYTPLPLGEGVMEYDALRAWLHTNRPEMPLLREEVQLAHDAADLQFMAGLVQ